MRVCPQCVPDEALSEFFEWNSTDVPCDCGAVGVSVAMEDFVTHIRASLYREYDDAANWLPFESREGGFLGKVYDPWDLMEVEELELQQQVRDHVAQELNDHVWCDVNPYGLNSAQQAEYSWSRFTQTVKHEFRFYFGLRPAATVADETLNPSELLRRMLDFALHQGKVIRIEQGSVYYRARSHHPGTPWTDPSNLGPPPAAFAIQSNRMSPPGIAMFYGSDDIETALRETSSRPGDFSVGAFRTLRDIRVLDLTELYLPSIFEIVPDTAEVDPRKAIQFLQHIAYEISQPIARDDRVHVEYVPTQVVSEFVRTQHLQLDAELEAVTVQIDGIRYSSAVSPGATSSVLFANQANVLGGSVENEVPCDPWLELVGITEEHVTQANLDAWADDQGS